MKLKKVLAVVLVAVMSVSSLAACSSPKNNDKETTEQEVSDAAEVEGEKSEAAGTTQAAQATASEEGKKLTIATWDYDTSPQFRVAVETFEEAHPGVTVEVIDTASAEYNNKLTVMLASGDSDPDIILVKDMATQLDMQEKGQLLDIDDYVKANIDISIYNGAAEQLKIDDKFYTLPYRSDFYILYYNKDVFDAAGEAYPSNDMTWDEYEQLAKKMSNGEGSERIYGSHNHIWMGLVSNWAVQDGENTLLSEDYSFLKPYYEQALRMQEEKTIQDYATLKTGNLHYSSVFQQGQVAMMPMGTWFISTLMQVKDAGEIDFNWGIAAIPHPEEVEAGNTVGAVTPIGIHAKTDEPELALDFIRIATSIETAEKLAENGIFTAVQSDDMLNKVAQLEGFPADNLDGLKIKGMVFDRPLAENMESVRKVIEEEHDLIMIGEEDIDTGITNMNERAKEVIENGQ